MRKELFKRVIKKHGAQMQMVVAMEEMAELQKELSKAIRGKGNKNSIAEEIADVEIMLEQMKIIFDCKKEVRGWKKIKLARIKKRMEGDKL